MTDAARARPVALFSCGAASAVATKLAQKRWPDLRILYTEVVEEHPDNKRFLADCERWFGQSVEVAGNDKYGRSIYDVFERERFIMSRHGANCTRHLKMRVRERVLKDAPVIVLGFTAEEEDRAEKFRAHHQHIVCPLIEEGMTKENCLAIVERAGIELPAMYRLGYKNNNCRGCVKGGKGYWNKVRADFPEYFERMAAMQDKLGPGSYFWQGKDGGERISLRMLNPTEGRIDDEPEIQCGLFCDAVAREIAS